MSAQHSISASTRAHSHWEAISRGEVTTLMRGYSPDAVLHWKEGAFEGDHLGAEAIRSVWIKFAKMRAPMTLTVGNVREKGGSQGSRIVTADVTLSSAAWTYPLAYCLAFQGGKIIEETWQMAKPDIDSGPLGP